MHSNKLIYRAFVWKSWLVYAELNSQFSKKLKHVFQNISRSTANMHGTAMHAIAFDPMKRIGWHVSMRFKNRFMRRLHQNVISMTFRMSEIIGRKCNARARARESFKFPKITNSTLDKSQFQHIRYFVYTDRLIKLPA